VSDQTFKEAWAHDFAPPIHSLDRHGDFAPPLLALGLAAGFFGVASVDDDTGGDGLQYHNGTYGADNEGDWFFAAANDTSAGPGAPSIGYTDSLGNVYPLGFSWQFDTGNSGAPVAITNDGGFLVDTAAEARIEATTEIDFETSVMEATIGSSSKVFLGSGASETIYDNSLSPLVDVTEAGQINILGKSPSGVVVAGGGPVTVGPTGGDSLEFGSTGNATLTLVTSGNTYTINDHLGSPLVTYTG
jgi:hypothetical protein